MQLSAAIFLAFVMGFAVGNQQMLSMAQSDTTPPRGTQKTFEPFWQVYNLIQSSYLDRDKVTSEQLANGAIQGMIDELGDQFSGYMTPETYPLVNDDLSGEVEGIGAVIETIADTQEIRIVHVLEGSPAEKAGLQSGDIFTAVNGEDVSGLNQLELVGKVRGPEGTVVHLTMLRGDELIEFTITRARIQIPNVEYRPLGNQIGYIKLREFSVNAYRQLNEALQQLDANNLIGIVLDLRGNPGGLLSSAIDVASMFIEDGTVLIEDFGNGHEQTYTTNGKYVGFEIPMTVLVDENSASASELVAGALQDQERATIVGTKTFGKGTVQTWQPLVNGGGVRLTIARWLTPNGNWIHGNGITPDIVVEWPVQDRDPENDPQLQAALNFLLTLDIEAVADRQDFASP
jgi:carboxyl-terminal processing protease